MQHTPSEVFHYTDCGGQSDAIHLSKSSTMLQAAKRDLLGIIQLQVTFQERSNMLELLVPGFGQFMVAELML